MSAARLDNGGHGGSSTAASGAAERRTRSALGLCVAGQVGSTLASGMDAVPVSSPAVTTVPPARWRDSGRWQLAVVVGAVVGAVVAVCVTLPADSLRYPG